MLMVLLIKPIKKEGYGRTQRSLNTHPKKVRVLKDFNKLSEFIKSIQDMSEEDFNDNIDLVETYLKVMFTYIQKIDKTGAS